MVKRIAIVIAGIIVVMLGKGFFFYSGFYSAPPSETPSYEHIEVSPALSAEFSDDATDNISQTVLIDLAHENNFDVEELNVLMLRLVSRGLTIKFLSTEDNLEKELLGKEEEKEAEPDKEKKEVKTTDKEKEGDQKEVKTLTKKEEEEKELPADVFIIVSPQKEFPKKDKKTIGKFVDNGGKLLLIADPTRQDKMNSISLEFGLIFEPDYLYNMKENDINFRNIFISAFQDNEITKNVKKIALYVAGSVSSANGGIAFVDQNTFSSMIESRKQLSPIALTQKAKVLGVHDLTFMTEPYNGIFDNNRLIANIADWLATPTEEGKKKL